MLFPDHMSGSIKSILEMTAWRMDAPAMFGVFHILAAAAVTAASFWAARILSVPAATGIAPVKANTRFDRILAVTGWILIITEIYKQLFLYYIVNNGAYDWWFFPFQLCSVPMYLCILLPFTGGRLRDAFITFMATYTFVSASAALAFPEDFLRSYVTLTAHGFLWHGILLFISLFILFSHQADLSHRGFARAAVLFIMLSTAAIMINVLSESRMTAAHDAHLIPNSFAAMFYLNPYHISPQPIIGTIQEMTCIPLGLALYALAVTAAADLVCVCFGRFSREKHLR